MDISAPENSIKAYIKLNGKEKRKQIIEILGERAREFSISLFNDIPILSHKKYGLQFVYVPGGEFLRGFTKENQEAAEKISRVVNANYSEMRPVKLERVSSFLITRTPILNSLKNSEGIQDRYSPLYCGYKEAESIANRMEMRLTSETEWEYCVRAGSDTLFPFGNELPVENELEQWMTQDFYDLKKSKSNELGIYGLFTGEWTCDVFHTDFSGQADGLTSKVIRGGGAYFWPWQDQEWVWCMSAMRMPSDDLVDNQCAFRLVIDV